MNYESSYYGIINSDQALSHFGIKGQKWGVRRFQYEDGSYTQAGLERYRKTKNTYNDSKQQLKKAKAAYKQGTGSEADVYRAKSKVMSAKNDVRNANRKLKEDVTRDKGRELYRKGKTIELNEKKMETGRTIAGVGMAIGAIGFQRYGQSLVSSLMSNRNISNASTASLASASIMLGSAAASGIIYAKYNSENKKMRTYWHNRSKEA